MKKLTLFFVLILSVSVLFAQEKRSKKQIRTERKSQKIQLIKSIIDNKTFVF